jgi:hypothetical protein
MSYDSTAHWALVTCPKCRARQTQFTLEHRVAVPAGPLRDKLLASGLFKEAAP